MNNCREWPVLIAIAALLLISPIVLYAGAYYALVRPFAINGSASRAIVTPGYPHCAMIDCYSSFAPMHAIDRRLRPNYWVQRVDPALIIALTADDVATSSAEPTP